MVKVGLALGGGGARGLAHIHALAALDDLGISPSVISGTSIGAIFGAAFAFGMSAAEIRQFTEDRFSNRWALLADLFRMDPRNSQNFFKEGGFRLGEIDGERLLKLLLPEDFATNFDQLKIPTKIVATNFYEQSDHIFDSGPLLPALAASSAIPAVFLPQLLDGNVFIDGGTTNPTPFDILADEVDIVVAIDVVGTPVGQRNSRPRKTKTLTATSHIMQRAIVQAKFEHFQPDILLSPPLDGVRVHEFMNVKRLLEKSAPLYEDLKRSLTRAIDEAT